MHVVDDILFLGMWFQGTIKLEYGAKYSYHDYMNESVAMFSGTVKDNIALFREYEDDSFKKDISELHMELDITKEIVD